MAETSTDPKWPLPHVSVLTSYFFSSRPGAAAKRCIQTGSPLVPTSIKAALSDGLPLLDLYFLGHRDIPFYAGIAGLEVKPWNWSTPLEFASNLTATDVPRVSRELVKALTHSYEGQLVGLRPRFTAAATYFPQITSPDAGDRDQACQALSNTMRIADLIGCRHIEFVAGSCTPAVDRNQTLSAARNDRSRHLVTSLSLVRQLYATWNDPNPPHLCLELEPGPAAVISGIADYVDLIEELDGEENRYSPLLLNVDIAHMMLQGISVGDLEPVLDRIGHMHISDHACHSEAGGVHGSDLPPGSFHNYERYEPWLQLAVKLTATSSVFSGVLALEIEGCGELDVIHSSCRLVRRWLRRARSRMHEPPFRQEHRSSTVGDAVGLAASTSSEPAGEFRQGAVLVVDLGNSTNHFFGVKRERFPGGAEECYEQAEERAPVMESRVPEFDAAGPAAEMNARNLQKIIEEMCGAVHEHRGSVLSFTGDGVVAFFDTAGFGSPESCSLAAAEAALQAACISEGDRKKGGGLTVRCGLHWGRVLVPSGGRLREQAIGADVVLASRLCSWLGAVIEAAVVPSKRSAYFAVSAECWKVLGEEFPALATETGSYRVRSWTEWPEIHLKGLRGTQGVQVSDRFEKVPAVMRQVRPRHAHSESR